MSKKRIFVSVDGGIKMKKKNLFSTQFVEISHELFCASTLMVLMMMTKNQECQTKKDVNFKQTVPTIVA